MTATATAQLLPFPASRPGPIDAIAVHVSREDGGSLRLRFELTGRLDQVMVPSRSASHRADGLWAHTCCEAFVGVGGSPAYREFNFSPSGQWAIYDFDDYRARASAVVPLPPPTITLDRRGDVLALDAMLAPAALPDGAVLQIGLATVVEAADGTLSYWALHHPGARPDFHHRDAFTLTLVRP